METDNAHHRYWQIGQLGDLPEFRFIIIVCKKNIVPVQRHASIGSLDIWVRSVRREDDSRFAGECDKSCVKVGI